MGIIEKIKSWFKEEPQKKHEENLSISDLENWIKKSLENIEENLKDKSENVYKNLLLLLEELEEKIKILEKVNINEKKEHERVKQITELGRKDYILELNKLIHGLKEKRAIPYINQEIEKFTQYSAKGRYKATYLIGKEIEEIISAISRIRFLENDFLKNNLELIQKYNSLKIIHTRNIERKSTYKIKNDIQTQIDKIEHTIQDKEKKIDYIVKKIQEVKESSKAKEKKELTNQKELTEESIKSLELDFKSLIDRRILEKYSYIEHDKEYKKILQSYIENPIEALIKDENIMIAELMKRIKEKIENNEIKVKDFQKAIEKIKDEKEIFLDYKNKIIRLYKNIKELEEKIKNIDVNTNHLENEISSIEKNREEDIKLLNTLSRKQEKIDIDINKENSELLEELKSQGINIIF